MRILFVDDDAGQQDLFNDAINDWNAGQEQRQFEAAMLSSPEEALSVLGRERFDCALFDLKFPAAGAPGQKLVGNQLARSGIEQYGIPIGIMSGEPGDLDADIAARGLLRTFVKNPGAYEAAVGWFASLWEMMEVLAASRARIRRSEAELFIGRIWPRWQNYSALTAGGAQLEAIVTRQFASHIADALGADGPDNPLWHPFEAYTFPRAEDQRAGTGDIFRLDEQLWVVLTPACDMAAGNIGHVLLAHCNTEMLDTWPAKRQQMIDFNAAGQPHSGGVQKYFRDLVNQNVESSRHFLPPLEGAPLLVNFKQIQTVPLAELTEQLTQRVACIAPTFLGNLIQRFGAYISRTGQPNLDIGFFAHV